MIIDDLPSISIANDSDEIAIEQGTATKKITKGNFLQEVTSAISSLLSSLSGKVSKAGDTITGNLDVKSTNIADGTVPTSETYGNNRIKLLDADDNVLGYLAIETTADNRVGAMLLARRVVNGAANTNGVFFFVDASGNKSVYLSEPAAWRSALGLGSVETGESGANLFTVASGFTLTEATCYKWGHVVEINLNITKTTAVTTPAFFTLGTIKVANKCPITVATAGSTDSALVNAYVLISGQVNCSVTSWAANTSKRIMATYLSA